MYVYYYFTLLLDKCKCAEISGINESLHSSRRDYYEVACFKLFHLSSNFQINNEVNSRVTFFFRLLAFSFFCFLVSFFYIL